MESEKTQIEELKELVRQNTALAKETHAMVKSMRNASRWARLLKLLWIVLIAAISFGAYIYLQPYLENIMQLYTTAQGAVEQARQFGQFR